MLTRLTRKARTMAAFAIASTTFCLASANVAQADEARDAYGDSDRAETHVQVNFADLDIATSHGAKLLFMRLQSAAETVCGDASLENASLREHFEITRCKQDAIESAVARVDRPALTALYDRHFPREPLEGASRVSFAPGQITPPVRVEVITLAPRRG